jgi:hypothetical protein
MWLTLASDAAGPQDSWIKEKHAAAFKQASDEDRSQALLYIERWIKGRRE